MPLYYAQPLRRALQRMFSGASNLVPDTIPDNCLSYTILQYIKRLKNQAKNEFDKLVSLVGKIPLHNHIDSIKLINNPYTKRLHDLVLINNNENSAINDTVVAANNNNNSTIIAAIKKSDLKNNDAQFVKNQKFLLSIRNDLNDFNGFVVRVKDRMKEAKPQCFKNAFDINRNDLIDQISRMKINFLQKNINDIRMHTDEQLHSLPIAQMGNYQEYLKKIQPSLRELEQQPVRQHMFGNPFKFDKKVQMMVDEADIDLVNNNNGNGAGNGTTNLNNNNGQKGIKRPINSNEFNQGRLIKRRPGPLSKDFVLKRPGSPVVIPQQQINNQLITPNLNGINNISNNLNNGLVQQIRNDNKLSNQLNNQANNTSIDKLENDSSSSNFMLTNNFSNKSPISQNSIDSYSDNSSNSSLSDSNDDSDLETISPPVSILNLMNNLNSSSSINQLDNSNTTSVNNKQPTGLHLLSVNSKQAIINSPNANHLSSNLTAINLINLSNDDIQLKKLLFKIVRRPGNNYEELFNLLLKHNNAIIKNYLVREVINEARRFKKRNLEQLLVKRFPFMAKSYQI